MIPKFENDNENSCGLRSRSTTLPETILRSGIRSNWQFALIFYTIQKIFHHFFKEKNNWSHFSEQIQFWLTVSVQNFLDYQNWIISTNSNIRIVFQIRFLGWKQRQRNFQKSEKKWQDKINWQLYKKSKQTANILAFIS